MLDPRHSVTTTFGTLCKLLHKAHPDCPLQLEALVRKTNPDQHGAVREVFSDITLAMGTETLLSRQSWRLSFLAIPHPLF